jgi:hypothetical protein
MREDCCAKSRVEVELKSWVEESGDEIRAKNLHSYRGCMKETNT